MTQGESEDLNRINCYFIKDSIGSYELKVLLKEGMPEVVGVLHAVDDASLQISLNKEVSVEYTLSRNEPLWRSRNRGLIFQHSKDCDAIHHQFFSVCFFWSVIQFETADSKELLSNDVSINIEPALLKSEGPD